MLHVVVRHCPWSPRSRSAWRRPCHYALPSRRTHPSVGGGTGVQRLNNAALNADLAMARAEFRGRVPKLQPFLATVSRFPNGRRVATRPIGTSFQCRHACSTELFSAYMTPCTPLRFRGNGGGDAWMGDVKRVTGQDAVSDQAHRNDAACPISSTCFAARADTWPWSDGRLQTSDLTARSAPLGVQRPNALIGGIEKSSRFSATRSSRWRQGARRQCRLLRRGPIRADHETKICRQH